MGYGDEIMITGYAKILKQKYPEHQIVAGNKKSSVISTSIFNNNPNINKFSEVKIMQTIWIESYSGNRPYFIKETEDKYYWNTKHRVKIGDLFFSENKLLRIYSILLNNGGMKDIIIISKILYL